MFNPLSRKISPLLWLVIFALPIPCYLGMMEHALRAIPNSYSVKHDRLERALADTEVLITGSSQSFYGIRASLLGPHAFNMAYVSQDLYYDTRLVLKYIDRMPKLRTVIIPISYLTWEFRLDTTGAEYWRRSFYYHVYGIRASRPPDLPDYSMLALYGPDEARRLVTQGPSEIDIGEDGGMAGGGLTSLPAKYLSVQEKLALYHSQMRPDVSTENLRCLEELLTALRGRGIRTLLVNTPVRPPYSSGMRPEAYRNMQSAVASLCARYGLRYLDHQDDNRFTEADFYDLDHLNLQGATRFTQLLRSEIRTP